MLELCHLSGGSWNGSAQWVQYDRKKKSETFPRHAQQLRRQLDSEKLIIFWVLKKCAAVLFLTAYNYSRGSPKQYEVMLNLYVSSLSVDPKHFKMVYGILVLTNLFISLARDKASSVEDEGDNSVNTCLR